MATKQAGTASDNIKPIPSHLKYDSKAFDTAEGETYGGSSEILGLAENEVAGPLHSLGLRTAVDLGNGLAPVDIHEAKDGEDNGYRLPIASNFKRQMELADMIKGDVFLVKRLPDAIKQKGAGKGNKMQMYQVKVIERKPRAAAQD